ncbi:MAG: hypothetical protein IK077_16510 [Thermoguttaceae bacterium]|nr:hypothetical protein [Thermoguttaceae bacterium]
MTIPIREDQRRVMITLSVDRYNELKATARAYSLSMTGIINALIGDYLKAERSGGADMTGAGLSARVDSLEKRLATLSALIADKRGRKRRPPKQTETDLTSAAAPGPFGGVPADHGDARTNDAPIMETEPPKASTVNALGLFPATYPAPIRETTPETKSTSTGTDGATGRPEPDAPIMENRNAEGRYRQRLEPATHDHADNPRARAASIAQRAPARVALASSLAKEETTGTRRHDHDGGNLRQTSTLERRLETKRRAIDYAMHGGGLRQSFAIQGAY